MAAQQDKRIGVIGAAIRCELNRPYILAQTGGNPDMARMLIEMELKNHQAQHAGKEPLR
jgi:hypothetical protein